MRRKSRRKNSWNVDLLTNDFALEAGMSPSEIFKTCAASIVRIEIPNEKRGSTGFLLEDGRTIITCKHSINAEKICVYSAQSDPLEMETEKTKADPALDLVQLRLKIRLKGGFQLNPKEGEIGETLHFMGFPFESEDVQLRTCYISGSHPIRGQLKYAGPIIAGMITPGFSGSPLINSNGQVLGLIWAKNHWNKLDWNEQPTDFDRMGKEAFVRIRDSIDRNLNVGFGYCIPSQLIANFLKNGNAIR